MNAVEIADAVAELTVAPFDAAEFPFAFLKALGFSETTLKRLRAGSSNKSDVPGAILSASNAHIAVAQPGKARDKLVELKASPRTAKAKCKFAIATDGEVVEAEELTTPEGRTFQYADLGKYVGFFFPLAGISTVKAIKDNPIDIRATGILNKLYMELMKDNPDWATDARRSDLNQFMARLIFCLFAEDTGIFVGGSLFSDCIKQFTDNQSSNTGEVIAELFRAMDTKPDERAKAKLKDWTSTFPYVNGGLLTQKVDCPRFSRIARSYLLAAGDLNWKEINPDIFGSMIQAVADDDERGELGMHYTSVPNILKVLDPLFLDDLREEHAKAGTNKPKLQKLRQRIAAIRVFDPACGSGNFLVIAYLKMREIEWEIIQRLGKAGDLFESRSQIKLTNFYGIEIKSFAVEIAKLSLLIAEFQANVRFLGVNDARAEVLPLHQSGQIHCGNALRLDWLKVCPPAKPADIVEHDLGGPTGRLALEDGPNAELYICGNPPYAGDKFQTPAQKADLKIALEGIIEANSIDYIVGWIWKASRYISCGSAYSFVSTNSITQGVQVPILWPPIFRLGHEIFFAHRSFAWSNNATRNANVICVIIGVRQRRAGPKFIFSEGHKREVSNISAYLVNGPQIIIQKHPTPLTPLPQMVAGNIARDEGHFMLTPDQRLSLLSRHPEAKEIVRKIVGSKDFIENLERYCLWIEDAHAELANRIPEIRERLHAIKTYRETGSDRGRLGVETPHRFERTITGRSHQLIVPRVSSERREYMPVGLLSSDVIISDAAQAIYDPPLFCLAIVSSRLHLTWVALTSGRMKTDYRYSTGVCYNSFPIPNLTENDKSALTRCAEDILLAREAHFPATIADLYDPDKMPDNLRRAHNKNDETLERIYIGRRFKNDTERLEKLFDMYTKMTKAEAAKIAKPKTKTKAASANAAKLKSTRALATSANPKAATRRQKSKTGSDKSKALGESRRPNQRKR